MHAHTHAHAHTNVYDIHIHIVAELQMFGSSANGFGSKSSDLDICLTLPGHDKVCTYTMNILCVFSAVRMVLELFSLFTSCPNSFTPVVVTSPSSQSPSNPDLSL